MDLTHRLLFTGHHEIKPQSVVMSIKWNNFFRSFTLAYRPCYASGSNLYRLSQATVGILIADPCSSVPDAANEISEKKKKVELVNIVVTSNIHGSRR